jgi:hypothetical protein
MENFQTSSDIHRQYKYDTNIASNSKIPSANTERLPLTRHVAEFFQMNAYKQCAYLVIQLHRVVQKSVDRKHSLNFI